MVNYGNSKKAGDKPRKVIKTNEERRRILESCHGKTEGTYLLCVLVMLGCASIAIIIRMFWKKLYCTNPVNLYDRRN